MLSTQQATTSKDCNNSHVGCSSVRKHSRDETAATATTRPVTVHAHVDGSGGEACVDAAATVMSVAAVVARRRLEDEATAVTRRTDEHGDDTRTHDRSANKHSGCDPHGVVVAPVRCTAATAATTTTAVTTPPSTPLTPLPRKAPMVALTTQGTHAASLRAPAPPATVPAAAAAVTRSQSTAVVFGDAQPQCTATSSSVQSSQAITTANTSPLCSQTTTASSSPLLASPCMAPAVLTTTTARDDDKPPPPPQQQEQHSNSNNNASTASVVLAGRMSKRAHNWTELLCRAMMQGRDAREQPHVWSVCARIVAALRGDAQAVKDAYAMLLVHLKDADNDELRCRVLDGTLPVEVLVTMGEHELVNPRRRRALDEAFAQRAKDRDLTEMRKAMQTTSTLFACPSCKVRDCTWTQRQTRSGDEPMTVFCTCNKCGHVWKRY